MLLDRTDPLWSNLLVRHLFLVVPVLVDLGFQAGAGTLDDLGPGYPVGVLLLLLGLVVAVAHGRVTAGAAVLATLLPLLEFAAVGALRLSPTPNGLGLLLVFPAMWLGVDRHLRGVLLAGLYTAVLVALPSLLYLPVTVANVGRFLMVVLFAVLVSLAMAMTGRAWVRREREAEEQRATITALLDSERRQRALTDAIVNAVDVGLVALGDDGSYRSMNPRHEDFMALAYPDGHSGRAGQLGWVFAADGERLLTREEMPTYKAHQGEEFQDYLIWVGESAQERRALAISARRVEREDGTALGQVLVYKDVTDLVTALQVKDDFVASVSHELRTPLTSIRGFVDLTLLDTELSPSSRRQLEVARKNTSRLLRLVNDLLFTAQTDQGRLSLEPVVLDLRALVAESVDEVVERAKEAEVRVELELGDPVLVEGDPLRLGQVVDNLLTNAIKYSLPGGTVLVSLTVDPRESPDAFPQVSLAIADEGIGIDERDQVRLFTRFFRARAAQERAIQGAGLGLSICKSIVEAHGGRIGLESALGEGTVFRVTLPLAPTSAAGEGPDSVAT